MTDDLERAYARQRRRKQRVARLWDYFIWTCLVLLFVGALAWGVWWRIRLWQLVLD